jgi:hypothetical protein
LLAKAKIEKSEQVPGEILHRDVLGNDVDKE